MSYIQKARLGASILAILLLVFIFGSLICPYSPSSTSLIDKNSAPTWTHVFGTDELGRDLFARTLQGMRISLTIGILAATLDLLIGTLWGTVAGFAPRRLEYVMMRIAELIYSFPYLLVVILVSVFVGTGILPLVVSMVCIGWIQMARVVRVLVKEARHADYILAAQALGVPPTRIFFHHMMPNIIGPMAAACMLSVPHAIFTEAFLSFLGIDLIISALVFTSSAISVNSFALCLFIKSSSSFSSTETGIEMLKICEGILFSSIVSLIIFLKSSGSFPSLIIFIK